MLEIVEIVCVAISFGSSHKMTGLLGMSETSCYLPSAVSDNPEMSNKNKYFSA